MNEKSYKINSTLSDKEVVEQLGAYIKHQRMLQNKSQDALSQDAGISRSTLSLLERGEPVSLVTLIQLLRALGRLSVLGSFEIYHQKSPLQLAKEEEKKRKRASKKDSKTPPKYYW